MDRRAIAVRGIVQGVGFRPFVYHLARQWGLCGFVRNRSGGVWIEVEGEPTSLDHFQRELTTGPPPLALIDEVSWEGRPPLGDTLFRIETSEAGGHADVFIGPEMATCPACQKELFDPTDRRYRYPFLNCTHCGPRLTIVQDVSYDRERTTMRAFAMCPACRAKYDDPDDRRFHAQPTACPACGPQLTLSRWRLSNPPATPPPALRTDHRRVEARRIRRQVRDQTGLTEVVLSGGVFQSVLLATEATDRLTAAGFRVYSHRLVPPNDCGLCLGQLAVAAASC